MLAAYLRQRGHVVDLITFSRQYPRVLFPGKTQEEPHGDSTANDAERLIDSINPMSWIRTARQLRLREFDLFLFQHWLPFFGPAFGSIARRVHRQGHGDIMVIVHNFVPHESRPGDRFLTHRLFRHATSAVTQSSVVSHQVEEAYPSLPQRMRPHPVYENFGERVDRGYARRMVGIGVDEKIILFFGFIRRYKGLDLLIEAMPEIARRVPDVRLVVAGEYYEDPEPYRQAIERSGMSDRITMHTDYVPNEDVATWFSASDVIVLPYRHATNSGIVQIAYNFAVPAIVTAVGSLAEIVIDTETGYVLPDAAPSTIAAAVAKVFEPGRIKAMSERILVERQRYSWDGLVDAIEELYDRSTRLPATD